MTRLRSIDRVVSRQVLVCGRITDNLTGEATLNAASVALDFRLRPDQSFRPLALERKPLAGGLYAFCGNSRAALPRPAAGSMLDIRITVAAKDYETSSVIVSLSAAAVTPAPQQRTIAGRVLELPLLDVPLVERDVQLVPLPLHLAARVVDADDRDLGLEGAQVRVVAPVAGAASLTDRDGFATIHDLPIAREIQVSVEMIGRTSVNVAVPLDYRYRTVERTFALGA